MEWGRPPPGYGKFHIFFLLFLKPSLSYTPWLIFSKFASNRITPLVAGIKTSSVQDLKRLEIIRKYHIDIYFLSLASVAVCLNLGRNRKYFLQIFCTAIGNITVILFNFYTIHEIFGKVLTLTTGNNFIETGYHIFMSSTSFIGVSFQDSTALLPEVGKNLRCQARAHLSTINSFQMS